MSKTRNSIKTNFSNKCKRPETVKKLKNRNAFRKIWLKSKKSKTSCARSVNKTVRISKRKMMQNILSLVLSQTKSLISAQPTQVSKMSRHVTAVVVRIRSLNLTTVAYFKLI